MTHTLFASDLHLCQERPQITRLFLAFLSGHAAKAQALYLLGDIFEYWAGDDDLDDPHHKPIITALRSLSDTGCQIFVMHGNRDFLMGDDFANACGAKILPDPVVIDLYGKRTLLSHGDIFCTDDTAYQEFRRQVRAPAWKSQFLSQPLQHRKAQIAGMRARSESEKSYKESTIMDVNAESVADALRTWNYPELLIHGHTHRPARHALKIDGRDCERIVLTDWDISSAGYLQCSSVGCIDHRIG